MRTAAVLMTMLLGASASAQQEPDSPPTVAFINPVNGRTVGGTVTVRISAQDDLGVKFVALAIGNGNCVRWVRLRTPPYTYSWNTRTQPNGNCLLRAAAVDTSDQARTVGIVVRVANGQVEPPQRAR